MRCIFVAILTVLTLVSSAPSRAEFGTRAEAVAMVKRAQAKFKKDGFDTLVRTINSGAKEFNDRDLYTFIVDFTGRNHANAVTPAITGKMIWDIKDQDGKFIVQDMIAITKEKASRKISRKSRPMSNAWAVPPTFLWPAASIRTSSPTPTRSA